MCECVCVREKERERVCAICHVAFAEIFSIIEKKTEDYLLARKR